MSPRTLRVLHLEDSELDHELALVHLRRAGLDVDCRRIESRAEFEAALAERWDVILSDYNLPGFSGLEALRLLQRSGQELPFIIVSGEIGEETAVDAMRNGASDYLLKHNLARLAPAVEHAIEASRPAGPAPAPTASCRPRSAACRSWRATCRPASSTNARRSRARSTTTSAAR